MMSWWLAKGGNKVVWSAKRIKLCEKEREKSELPMGFAGRACVCVCIEHDFVLALFASVRVDSCMELW